MGSKRTRVSVKGRTGVTMGRREFDRKPLPERWRLRILPVMTTNPLIALRVALPGQPSTRALAKVIGCSHELLRRFELGVVELGPVYLVKYAKAVGSTANEVERRWLFIALEAVHRRRTEIHDRLRELGVSDPRRRAGRKSA